MDLSSDVETSYFVYRKWAIKFIRSLRSEEYGGLRDNNSLKDEFYNRFLPHARIYYSESPRKLQEITHLTHLASTQNQPVDWPSLKTIRSRYLNPLTNVSNEPFYF